MGRPTRYPPQIRALAVARVARIRSNQRSDWQAIKIVAAEVGVSAETLRSWVRQSEAARSQDHRRDLADLAELRRLREENARLRQALDLMLREAGAVALAHGAVHQVGSGADGIGVSTLAGAVPERTEPTLGDADRQPLTPGDSDRAGFDAGGEGHQTPGLDPARDPGSPARDPGGAVPVQHRPVPPGP
ncbi:Transposase [Frankia sp. EI5c]|uniref:transposase n=1 Tax=Frankia sp. EI5c TaxID=683316 RepID=UPI0007C26EC7|nr:transposase [Frankia sp. EI5c]OAA21586.1 Transposase [Frankia sp. EI5c]